eukprot:gene819-4099_t
MLAWYICYAFGALAVRAHQTTLAISLSVLPAVILLVLAKPVIPHEVLITYLFATITQGSRLIDAACGCYFITTRANAQYLTNTSPKRTVQLGNYYKYVPTENDFKNKQTEWTYFSKYCSNASSKIETKQRNHFLEKAQANCLDNDCTDSCKKRQNPWCPASTIHHQRHNLFMTSSPMFSILYILSYHDLSQAKRSPTRWHVIVKAWQDNRTGIALWVITGAIFLLVLSTQKVTVEQARLHTHRPHNVDMHPLPTKHVHPVHSELFPEISSPSFFGIPTEVIGFFFSIFVHVVLTLYGVAGIFAVDFLWRSIYGLFRLSCRATMHLDSLTSATTVRTFWREWNQEVQRLLHLTVYLPVKAILTDRVNPKTAAIISSTATFSSSALLHILPFLCAGVTTSFHLAMIATFFVLQPIFISVEEYFQLKTRVWVFTCFFGSSLLLTQPFLAHVSPQFALHI